MTDTPKNREELDRMLEYQIDAAVKVKVHSDGDVTTKVNVLLPDGDLERVKLKMRRDA